MLFICLIHFVWLLQYWELNPVLVLSKSGLHRETLSKKEKKKDNWNDKKKKKRMQNPGRWPVCKVLAIKV